MTTWALLGAGVAIGIAITLMVAWLFSIERRVTRLEGALERANPYGEAASSSTELTVQ